MEEKDSIGILRKAGGLIRISNFAGAVALMTDAISRDPKVLQFYDYRALARLNMGDLEDALDDSLEMVRLDPGNPKGYLHGGKAFCLMGKNESAFRIYKIGRKKVARDHPRYLDIDKLYNELASTAIIKGKVENAPAKRRKTDSGPRTSESGTLAMKKEFANDRKTGRPTDLGAGGKQSLSVLDLPREIFDAICSYLPLAVRFRCTGICRGWRESMYANKLLWADLDFEASGKRATNVALQTAAIRSGPLLLRQLVLKDSQNITAVGIRAFATKKFVALTRLEFTWNSKVTNVAFASLFKMSTPALVRLNLSHTAVGDEAVATALASCPNLTYLDVSYCPAITDKAFQARSGAAKALTHVNVAGCAISDSTTETLVKTCPALTHLDLTVCVAVTSRTLISVATSPTISSIRLTGTNMRAPNGNMLNDSILAFAKGCRALSIFSLASCPQIGPNEITHLASFCPDLQDIDLTQCAKINDASIIALATGCRSIRTLLVGTCPRVTDVGIMALVADQPQLIQLDVSNNPSITDRTVEVLSKHMVIRRLNMSNCSKISGSAVIKLATKPGQPLASLLLDNCPRVHHETVAKIRAVLPKASISARFH